MIKLNNTTYKHEIKTDLKDELNCVIGDDKEKDFKPQMKIQRWQNECNVSIRLIEDDKEKPTIETEEGKIKYIKKDRECHFYQIKNKEHPEGASEFEIILKKKPKTNVIKFSVVDKDVNYFYQPELTDAEVQEMATKENITLLEAKRKCRPENVIGSYAIYAKTPKTNYVGQKEYKCGKIGHIFRPQMIDAKGNKVWGKLHIEKGILSVEIPQEFLENAVYPIRHAAGLTFGYTTIGSSSDLTSWGKIMGSKFLGAAGTGISISAYFSINQTSATAKVKFGIYKSDLTFLTNSETAVAEGKTDAETYWQTLDFSIAPTLEAVNYWLVAMLYVPSGAGNYGWKYDAGVAEQGGYASQIWGVFPSTWSPTYTTNKYSIYATYTAGGGTATDKFFLMF